MPTPVPPGPLAGETQVDFVNNGQSAVQIPVGDSGNPIVVPPTGIIRSYGLTADELVVLEERTGFVPPAAQPAPNVLDVTVD